MRKGCWWTILGVGTLAVYAGVRVFLVYWDFGQAASELPKAMRDYRAQGLPWTAADLERHVADGENAAHHVRLALAALPSEKAQKEFDSAYREGTAGRYLPEFEKSLGLFHQAASFRKLDYHRDWDQGPNLLFREFPYFKRMARAFGTRAERSAAAGDDRAALRDLEDSRKLAVLTAQEPVMIATLVSIACEKIVLSSAERCLAHAAQSTDRLFDYRDWLSQIETFPDMRNAIRFEVYGSLVFARNLDRLGGLKSVNPLSDFDFLISEEGVTVSGLGMRREGVPPDTRAKAYMTRHLQSWSELYARTHGLRADEPTIDRIWNEIDDRQSRSKGLSHQLDVLLFPRFSEALKSPQGLVLARNKALALANALLKKRRTGRWPIAVAEIDPFTGRPLHVRFDGKRFRIWSVGKNGIDEGGLSSSEAYALGKRSDDVVAAYPPIPNLAALPKP